MFKDVVQMVGQIALDFRETGEYDSVATVVDDDNDEGGGKKTI